MKIMFSGGATLGPVVPLLAIYEIYKKQYPDAEFVWVGTRKGPEKELVERYKIPFFAISCGKLRRYFSFLNFFDAFKIVIGYLQSLILLWQEKPDILITAGGFVSVPLHWASVLLGIPKWVHQQDVQVGLANKLMARSADKITVALREGINFFPEQKTEWIGNPARDLAVKNIAEARIRLGLPPAGPVIFALGGGTGSNKINKLVLEALPSWPKEWSVLHLVGRERPSELQMRASGAFSNYHVYQFFTEEMKDAYAVADVVIARAGFSTITELASLGKAAIVVPIFGTHQEVNAKMLSDSKAVIVLHEKTDTGLKLAHIVRDLIENPDIRQYLGNRLRTVLPPAKPEKVIEIINQLTEKK